MAATVPTSVDVFRCGQHVFDGTYKVDGATQGDMYDFQIRAFQIIGDELVRVPDINDVFSTKPSEHQPIQFRSVVSFPEQLEMRHPDRRYAVFVRVVNRRLAAGAETAFIAQQRQ